MNYIAAYNEQIQSGKIAASRRIKAVYSRLSAACNDRSGNYVFDENRASRPM